jgi:hypothetical protein
MGRMVGRDGRSGRPVGTTGVPIIRPDSQDCAVGIVIKK